MDQQSKKITQYRSKWNGKWVNFKQPPTDGQLYELKKYNYELR